MPFVDRSLSGKWGKTQRQGRAAHTLFIIRTQCVSISIYLLYTGQAASAVSAGLELKTTVLPTVDQQLWLKIRKKKTLTLQNIHPNWVIWSRFAERFQSYFSPKPRVVKFHLFPVENDPSDSLESWLSDLYQFIYILFGKTNKQTDWRVLEKCKSKASEKFWDFGEALNLVPQPQKTSVYFLLLFYGLVSK